MAVPTPIPIPQPASLLRFGDLKYLVEVFEDAYNTPCIENLLELAKLTVLAVQTLPPSRRILPYICLGKKAFELPPVEAVAFKPLCLIIMAIPTSRVKSNTSKRHHFKVCRA
jgi:hypothetical protein